jgi:SAM-dependent methyltransferase
MKKWRSEELMSVCCDFCGNGGNPAKYVRADGMQVAECTECGLAYLNPRPKPEFISDFYDKDYFTGAAAARGEGGLTCDINAVGQSQTGEQPHPPRPVEIVRARYGGFQGKDVLEVGCATGELLLEVKNAGARVNGVELSDFAAEIARKRALDVMTGTIEDIVSTQKQFDVVMAFEVIEHVLSPTRFLADIARVLRPGGVFLVSTPNYACARRFGTAWYGFNASFEHIYFYSLAVLRAMAEKKGLALDYWETSTITGGPDYSASFFRLQIERLRNLLFFIKEIGVCRTVRAVLRKKSGYYPYGAGHTLVAVFKRQAEQEHS